MGDDFDSVDEVDFSNSKDVENFLEHNLREGYYSEDEQTFVQELVSRYSNFLDRKKNAQKVVRNIQLNEVGSN